MTMRRDGLYLVMALVLFVTYIAMIPAVFSLEGRYFWLEVFVLVGLILLGAYGMINFNMKRGWEAFSVLFFVVLLNQLVFVLMWKMSWTVSVVGVIGFLVVAINYSMMMSKKSHKVRIVTLGKKTAKRSKRKSKRKVVRRKRR